MATNNIPSLNSIFERNADLMLPEILKRSEGKNMFIDIFDKGVWPTGMGDKLDILTVERSFVDGSSEAGDDWTAVVTNQSTNDGATAPAAANSLPPTQYLLQGQTRKETSLFWKAIETEPFNIELIRGAHELERQLSLTERAYTQGLIRELEKRFIYAYLQTSGNLINCSKSDNFSTINAGIVGFPHSDLPDSQLEQGFLDTIWDMMENETQGEGSIGSSEDGTHVYMLMCEPLTSRGLKENNASIRQDINYAHMGTKMESPLLQPYGMGGRCYGNFVHKTYKQMPRYDYVPGSGLVRRAYWIKKAVALDAGRGITGGRGYEWVVNPQWVSAQFTTSFVINTKVFKWLVPGMLDSPGGNVAVQTPNYFPKGIQWVNERNLDKSSTAYNPDKTIGFYRAVMAAAIEPDFPTYGWCILHKKFAPTAFGTYSGGQGGYGPHGT